MKYYMKIIGVDQRIHLYYLFLIICFRVICNPFLTCIHVAWLEVSPGRNIPAYADRVKPMSSLCFGFKLLKKQNAVTVIC